MSFFFLPIFHSSWNGVHKLQPHFFFCHNSNNSRWQMGLGKTTTSGRQTHQAIVLFQTHVGANSLIVILQEVLNSDAKATVTPQKRLRDFQKRLRDFQKRLRDFQKRLRDFPHPWYLLPGLLYRQLHRRNNIPGVIMLKRRYAYIYAL